MDAPSVRAFERSPLLQRRASSTLIDGRLVVAGANGALALCETLEQLKAAIER